MPRPRLPKQKKDLGPDVPLVFYFAFKPEPAKRLRSRITKQLKIQTWTPRETVDYENEINKLALQQHLILEPFTARLELILNFRFQGERHGDIDNVEKAILDGFQPKYRDDKCTRPGVFRNDACVKKVHKEFFYDKQIESCVEVILRRHKSRPWSERLRSFEAKD